MVERKFDKYVRHCKLCRLPGNVRFGYAPAFCGHSRNVKTRAALNQCVKVFPKVAGPKACERINDSISDQYRRIPCQEH